MKTTPIMILIIALCQVAVFGGARAPQQKSILLLATPPSHGEGEHQHHAGVAILEKALNESGLNLKTAVHLDSWPEAAAFEGVDAVVIYGDGNKDHIAAGHADSLRALSGTGVGIVCIHYALDGLPGPLEEALMKSVGAFYDDVKSHNPVWTAKDMQLGDHPAARGIAPFELKEEWYYFLNFRDGMEGITPILSVLPPEEALKPKGKKKPVSPELVAEVKAGKKQHLVWASVNLNGSRGFGFTGGHFHKSWAHPMYRRLVLNGIVWAAGLDVPDGGVQSTDPVIPTYPNIMHAVARGDAEDVQRHIQAGTDINAPQNGWTPLQQATVRGKTEIAAILLENGAEVDARTGSQKTSLIFSAERNFKELTEVLLKHGADVNAQDNTGWGAMHYAAAKDRVEMAEFLISQGAKVNLTSSGGGTPLIEGAASGSPEMIKLLLKHGADKSIKAKNGKTALDYAIELENKPVVPLLK